MDVEAHETEEQAAKRYRDIAFAREMGAYQALAAVQAVVAKYHTERMSWMAKAHELKVEPIETLPGASADEDAVIPERMLELARSVKQATDALTAAQFQRKSTDVEFEAFVSARRAYDSVQRLWLESL